MLNFTRTQRPGAGVTPGHKGQACDPLLEGGAHSAGWLTPSAGAWLAARTARGKPLPPSRRAGPLGLDAELRADTAQALMKCLGHTSYLQQERKHNHAGHTPGHFKGPGGCTARPSP